MFCYHFFNFFFGFLSQVAPCALLCILPLKTDAIMDASSWKRKEQGFTLLVFLCALFFSVASSFIAYFYLVKGYSFYPSAYLIINLLFILFTIACFVIYAILIPKNTRKKIFLFLFSFNYGMFISIFSMLFSNFVPDDPDTVGLPYKTSMILFLFVANGILLPIFIHIARSLLRMFPTDAPNEMTQKETIYSKLLFLLPIPFIILTLFCSLLGNNDTYHNPIFILLVITLVLIQLLFYWFLAGYVSHTVEIITQKKQYDMILSSYRILQEHLESMRVFRHEFNRHITTVSAYLNAGNTEDAISYLNELHGDIAISSSYMYCKHPLINSIVGFFLPALEKDGVEVSHSIMLPETLPIPDNHIVGLLYNLLENASESLAYQRSHRNGEESEKPFLKLQIFIRQENLMIICTNSKIHKIKKDKYGNLLSTKEDSMHHGYGFHVIQNITSAHNGILEYRDSGEEFEVCIAIHLVE